MKLTGLMPVRNEDWVLGLSARVALLWCDDLVILLHACTDGSAGIAERVQAEHRGRVHILVEPEEKWDEMNHRQHLLCGARSFGATHIALVDADEVLVNHSALTRMYVDRLDAGKYLQLPLYNARGSHMLYHANGTWGTRWVTVAFVDDVRLGWSGDRFHHREPEGLHLQQWRPMQHGNGGVIHLWGASERRLRAKHALYKMVETLRFPGKQKMFIDAYYNLAMVDMNWKYNEVPTEWWRQYHDAGLMDHLCVDADPWQEQECQRLVQEHGRQRFDGLNLFGVV